MGNNENDRFVFPITSLQIGDLQSYLSHLGLFLAPESKKFYILVDNQPWLKDLVSRPTHLWQLMVTKSRLSPFANTKVKKERRETGELYELQATSESNTSQLKKWFLLLDVATSSRKRALLPVKKLRNSLITNSKLHRTLYGFIVFEVAWSDVRGINYFNELQNDTSLVTEAKYMRRWEFDSVAQSARCLSSWFPGTCNEQILLKDYLDATTGEGFHDAQENFPRTGNIEGDSIICDDLLAGSEYPCCLSSSFRVYPATIENGTSRLHTPPPPHGPYKRRRMSVNGDVEGDTYSEEADPETTALPINSQASHASDCVNLVKATHYRDVLISFRFSDPNLPFKLKEIIMSDLRLLTLLESGLPSWVIFLQSYPGFCHIYRPWMCPLARALYVIISIVTVLIGFYDLYKNIPVLTATASHLFGPLFDWIESWEMISRIEYLGTMLFLQNFQKAFKWFIMITRPIRSFLSILTQPMAGLFVEFLDFFLPFWNMCIQFLEGFFTVIWMMVESSCTLVGELVEILLLPLWYIMSFMWNVVTSLMFPIFWILVEILYAPMRFGLGLCNLVAFVCRCMYDLIGDIYLVLSDTFQFTTNVESTVSSYEVSMWRSLWNDIFSQVFRALRSILNGLVAFFVACNRHRLSIYNHVKEFIQKLSAKRTRAVENIHD
ncbi:uncharacterized protein LOC111396826 [Olea europaea var. sylvestris]|uniref:Uncharacterized protein LOC111396826 n=1 Tax=Olea europaea subsp. europaea TaxID=158383 RepID=A0A8S0UKN6_OLEEU|nr:uncharacterized protein LOC111396826 [Olea europaea var. sylvestris]XP_022879126.1 uncharacterized protein LOC111396826 [Olea europaea var. sylvestris]CAA3017396.1 uncharacterized protein LOC111396826 [Olea europaea subsp. europaea]